ncbi:MAG TPA: hypothetical protein VJU61_06835 [Polyangiaceae bacterium]|nr:hypothetical protein [Polyangiaceae bacterium]
MKPAAVAAEQLAARVKAAEVAVDQHLMPQPPLPARPLAKQTPDERDADLLAVAAATPAVPPVAPRSMQPAHRRASGRLPVVPLAELQAPSPGRTDPTPSPVPRVSLVPPTGRIDRARQVLHGDARNQPTVAARRNADVAAAHTVPPTDRVLRRGFLRRLAKDLRSSKREVLLGLGIGIGLSFALVRWGQEYVAQRAMPDSGPEFRVESLAVHPARLPAAAPAAALPTAQFPAAQFPAGQLSATPLPGLQLSGRLPATVPADASGRAPAALKETSPMAQAVFSGARPTGQRRSSAAGKSSKPSAAARTHSGGASGVDVRAEDAPLQAPGEELEPREKAPLSPSQSAGLGLDLPL